MSDLVTPRTGGCQGFLRQEYWSGLPLPSPGDLPDPGIKSASLALVGGFFSTEPPGKPGWKKKDILLAWQQPSQCETVMTLPMKSHYTSNSRFPPVNILFITAPLHSSFSVKECSSPLFSKPAGGLPQIPRPELQLFAIIEYTYFAGKILDNFNF